MRLVQNVRVSEIFCFKRILQKSFKTRRINKCVTVIEVFNMLFISAIFFLMFYHIGMNYS